MGDKAVIEFYISMIPRGSTFILWQDLAEDTKQWWRDQYFRRFDGTSDKVIPHEYTNPYESGL